MTDLTLRFAAIEELTNDLDLSASEAADKIYQAQPWLFDQRWVDAERESYV